MWALKGTFLGISIFAVGAAVFLLLFQWSRGPLLAGAGHQESFDIRAIPLVTIYSAWFWAAFAACIVIGLAIVRSWPGRFSPVFWVVLVVLDLVPAGLLGLVLLLVSRLKDVAAATSK